MSRPRSPRNGSQPLTWLFGLLVVTVTACDVPNFDGPQIQSPPRGFLLVQDSQLPRRMFQHHDVIFQTAWVESITDFSTIHVNGHAGVLDFEDVMAAQDTARRIAQDPDIVFGPVEPLRIDGRGAWGWEERVESETRGLEWVAYRAAVAYDDVTYAIEFYSGEPALKRAAPDTLRAIVGSFAVGRTTWNVPLIALLAGGLLFVVAGVRSRAKARAARLQTINLVKIQAKEPGEESGTGTASADAPAAGAAAQTQPPLPAPGARPDGPAG